MPKILLTFSCIFLLACAFGQHTELTVSLNSGLFSFAGRSTTSSSFINSNPAHGGYTNDPYGTDPDVSYGLSAGVKRVVRRHWLLGVDGGYEVLRSSVRVDQIDVVAPAGAVALAVHGHSILTSRFITVEPYVGYRLAPGKVTVDLSGGIDLAGCLGTRESGTATADNGSTYRTSVNRKTISFDLRPRVQVTGGYRRIFIYVGYSLGLNNYMEGYVGGPAFGAYARLVRFGVGYRFS